jgi:DedD protein
MSLAFWRRKPKADDATSPRSSRAAGGDDDAGPRADPAATLRARARRRLIGAAALLLLVIIVVPMVLDPEPRPVPDNIPIDIPSEKSKFSPRLALPPVPAPETVPVPPPDAAPAPAAPAADAAAAPDTAKKESVDVTKKESSDAARKDAVRTAAAAKSEEQRARAALENKAPEAAITPTKGGKFAVQAAATSSEASARELSERLKKAGLLPYTEGVQTAEGMRYRVRVGPYATRDEAERVRARLKALGISANVVTP